MQSFYTRFLQSVERFPQHIALELQPAAPGEAITSISYSDTRTMVESVGWWLRDSGVQPGARCAILAANSPRWVISYLGILSHGCVAVPLDTAFDPEQICKLLLDSGSSVIFTDAKAVGSVTRAIAGLNIIPVILDSNHDFIPDSIHDFIHDGSAHVPQSFDQILARDGTGLTSHAGTPDDLAVILYTSGTTSDPKGVMLTHGNLNAEAQAVFALLRFDQTDAILGVLPLFHALAQMANLLFPLSVGARVVYLEQLNTSELLRGLRKRRITLFCCVPQFFYLIHQRIFDQVAKRGAPARIAFRAMLGLSIAARRLGINLGKTFFRRAHQALGKEMRFLVTGGSRFDVKIGKDLEALGFDVLQAYGLTETTGGATCVPPGERFTGSVGRPLPGMEVQISAPDENGSGEVLIRGGIVMKGYYNRPDATEQVLKDGWLHTGDLGHLDGRGNLFLTGRQKDVIVLSSGKNVYPEEIEAHYLKSPFLKEICVLGLQSAPGEPFSERLHAVIVPNLDMLREKKIVNTREVIRFDVETLSAQLPSTKRILSYDIWQDDLPRTTTRKLKRFEIDKLVKQQRSPADSGISSAREISAEDMSWLQLPDVARAVEVVRRAAKDSHTISPADNLELDLGLDSMQRVELVVALEQELDASADEALVSSAYTVRELVEAVRAGIGSRISKVRAGWQEVFSSETSDPDVLALIKPKPFSTAFWFCVDMTVRTLSRLLFRLRVEGMEKLPAKGPFLICPNHQSFFDGPVLVSQLPLRLFRQVFYVGTSEIFGSGFMRTLARSMKLIPVDPDANLVPALRAGSFGLKNRMVLILYPEGERSIDGVPKTFRRGAAILAVHHNIPIYPVAIDGFFDSWPRGFGFKGFHRARIRVGDPIFPPHPPAASPEAAYQQIIASVEARVSEMWTGIHAQLHPQAQ